MNFSKYAALTLAAALAIAATPILAAQQNPESAPTEVPPAAVTAAPPAAAAAPAGETDEAAALIARANMAAAANAKAEAAPVVAKNEPSPEARKKAREYGFHAEIYDGKTFFCKDDATLGTRIQSKRCMDSEDFEDYGRMMQIARDLMKSKNQCQGGSICGGLQ